MGERVNTRWLSVLGWAAQERLTPDAGPPQRRCPSRRSRRESARRQDLPGPGIPVAPGKAQVTTSHGRKEAMKKTLGIALALLLTLGLAGAWAGEVEGKIQSLDSSDRMIVLEDGTRLWLAEGLSMDTLKEGAKVKASFEERDGKNVVTGITVSE
jgi:ferric-dicitrate binding protein FerR (iron transport regulator)